MSRTAAVALGVVVLTVFLSPLRRELYVGDETKYSQVVREMRAGAFFLPTLHGSPFTHKPPVHFWIVDLLTYPFGVYSIWPFVLPSLVAFLALLWLMHRFAGPMGAFVCGTSLLVWGSAQTARMDVEFTALLALAALFIFRANGALPLSAGVVTGIATLVKGPMAPVITLALFVFESIRRRRKPVAKDFLALVPMIVIPLLWLVPALVIGGEEFWREIFFKQTVGRAVGSWVHQSPPWFYLVRAPLTLMPWFFLLVAALIRVRDEAAKFGLSWILAVLVPYSLLSSKLDVYMMAMIPAVALVIARFVDSSEQRPAGGGQGEPDAPDSRPLPTARRPLLLDAWGRGANALMLVLFAVIGVAGMFVQPERIRTEDAALVARPDVRLLFAILLVAAIAAVIVTLRGSLRASTFATGLVPVIALAYAAIALVPLANELASTKPLVRVLERQRVAPQNVGLYVCPHLWTRGMDPAWSRARHLQRGERMPRVVVVRRKNAPEIAAALGEHRKVDELRMIGKWFDVYRR